MGHQPPVFNHPQISVEFLEISGKMALSSCTLFKLAFSLENQSPYLCVTQMRELERHGQQV